MRTFKKNNSFKLIRVIKNVFIIIALGILVARYYFANQVHAYRDGYLLPIIIVLTLIVLTQIFYEKYINHVLLSQLTFKSWREKHIFMTSINDLDYNEDYLIKNLAKKNITNRSDVQRYIKNYEHYMKLQNIL